MHLDPLREVAGCNNHVLIAPWRPCRPLLTAQKLGSRLIIRAACFYHAYILPGMSGICECSLLHPQPCQSSSKHLATFSTFFVRQSVRMCEPRGIVLIPKEVQRPRELSKYEYPLERTFCEREYHLAWGIRRDGTSLSWPAFYPGRWRSSQSGRLQSASNNASFITFIFEQSVLLRAGLGVPVFVVSSLKDLSNLSQQLELVMDPSLVSIILTMQFTLLDVHKDCFMYAANVIATPIKENTKHIIDIYSYERS